jgi:ferric iron reductase protein FhuF
VVLQKEEIQLLQQDFQVSQGVSLDSVRASQLIDPDHCKDFLAKLSTLFRSPSLSVTASQFAKKYTYHVVLPALFAMSRWNKGLQSHIENYLLEAPLSTKQWSPRIRLIDETVIYPIDDRLGWRDQVIQQIFAKNITILWKVLHEISGIPMNVLWENTAIYIFWLYEEKLKKVDPIIRKRAEDDFQYLLEADAKLFATEENPLCKYYKPKLYCHEKGELLRRRQTCCLHYQLQKNGRYCKTCPKSKKLN